MQCLINLRDNATGVLQRTIYQAIINLYTQGHHLMTARQVRDECNNINDQQVSNSRLPAIYNSMRNTKACGFQIVGEDRAHLEFTIRYNEKSAGNKKSLQTLSQSKIVTKKKGNNSTNTTVKIDQEKIEVSKNFKVVMICAGRKHPHNELIVNNNVIHFKAVSNPDNNVFLPSDEVPDRLVTNYKKNWYEYIQENQHTIVSMAYQLYVHAAYANLFHALNNSFYILSAGWGLVNAKYKLPDYNITFSGNTIETKRNAHNEHLFHDFNQLAEDITNSKSEHEDIIYIGGVSYRQQFYTLTENLKNRKIIYYIGKEVPILPNQTFIARRFYPNNPNLHTNWHYDLAQIIAQGQIP